MPDITYVKDESSHRKNSVVAIGIDTKTPGNFVLVVEKAQREDIISHLKDTGIYVAASYNDATTNGYPETFRAIYALETSLEDIVMALPPESISKTLHKGAQSVWEKTEEALADADKPLTKEHGGKITSYPSSREYTRPKGDTHPVHSVSALMGGKRDLPDKTTLQVKMLDNAKAVKEHLAEAGLKAEINAPPEVMGGMISGGLVKVDVYAPADKTVFTLSQDKYQRADYRYISKVLVNDVARGEHQHREDARKAIQGEGGILSEADYRKLDEKRLTSDAGKKLFTRRYEEEKRGNSPDEGHTR